ncbi:MAG: helix-hairpin-helix domain-containing protein, partial [Desulfobacterales bacterium]
AIGKRGQNVRLASRLAGWHLDVKSETKYSEAMRSGYDSLLALTGVGISLADALYEKGFFSAEEISKASVEDLIQVKGIGEESAIKLIDASEQAIQTETAEDEPTAAIDTAGDQIVEATAETDETDETDEPVEPVEPAAAVEPTGEE